MFQIRDRCKDLVYSDEQCREVMKRLTNDLNKGLGKKSHASAIVKCFVTYVQDLPDGSGNLKEFKYYQAIPIVNYL